MSSMHYKLRYLILQVGHLTQVRPMPFVISYSATFLSQFFPFLRKLVPKSIGFTFEHLSSFSGGQSEIKLSVCGPPKLQ
jgi:hypothetical protein